MSFLGSLRNAKTMLATRFFRCLVPLAIVATTVLSISSPARAQVSNIYLAQNAQGTANGADCNDAVAYTFFNSSANWGENSGQIGPGTTVHLCGTITGEANTTLLTFQGSGASGHPVTLLFETGAVLASPVWTGVGAILVANVNHIVIDGGSGGIIQNTQNGTRLMYETNSGGISLQNNNDVTVQNVKIINLCQVTDPADEASVSCGTAGIFVGPGANNITIQHNVIHDTTYGIYYNAANGDSGNNFQYNTIYRVDNSIGAGSCSSACTTAGFNLIGNDLSCIATPGIPLTTGTIMSGQNTLTVVSPAGYSIGQAISVDQQGGANRLYANITNITGNVFTLSANATATLTAQQVGPLCNWADGADQHHLEVVHIYLATPGVVYTGATFANNYLHDMGVGNVTGGFNLENGSGTTITAFNIFNNVINMSYGGYCTGSGSGGSNFYNNTFVGCQWGATDPPATIENSVFSNGNGNAFILFLSLLSGSTVNHNDFYGSGNWSTGATNYTTLGTWQAKSAGVCNGGCDLNSITTNPNLTAAFVPNSGSPVIGAGANLTSLGITLLDSGAPQYFGVSYACGTGCVARPATGAWDMGAYEFTGSANSQQPAPPTGVVATVQ